MESGEMLTCKQGYEQSRQEGILLEEGAQESSLVIAANFPVQWIVISLGHVRWR